MNSSGTVVFSDQFAGAIFTQFGVVAAVGDVVGGKTIDSLGSVAINDSGNVAFYARFTDNTTGILLAQQQAQATPETSTSFLFGGGLLALGITSRLRRRACRS